MLTKQRLSSFPSSDAVVSSGVVEPRRSRPAVGQGHTRPDRVS